MKGINMALGLVVLGSVLTGACGSSEQTGGATATAPAATPSTEAPAGNVEITLTTQPDPPTIGEATFEATVMSGGQPVTDGDVSVELFMAAMPAMKMPEMRNTVALKHEGGGRYRGRGNVMMAGNWDATVSVRRGGEEIGNRKVPIAAK